MEATQVKTEEAVQAPGKKEPPKLKVPKKKKKWLKRLIIAVVVLPAIFLIFIRPMMSAGQQFVAGTYLPETAQRQDLRISVSSTGTITPIDSYKVSALVNGEIVEAPFEEGDWVEKGALLYRFDAEDAQNAVQQAQLSVAQAELGYRTAQESVNPYSTASGIVQKLYVSVGDPVAVGDPIADVGDNTTMTVEIPFHSADAAGLYVGQTGTLTIEGTMETVTGTIESISGADEVGAGGALIRQVKFRVSNPGRTDRHHRRHRCGGQRGLRRKRHLQPKHRPDRGGTDSGGDHRPPCHLRKSGVLRHCAGHHRRYCRGDHPGERPHRRGERQAGPGQPAPGPGEL